VKSVIYGYTVLLELGITNNAYFEVVFVVIRYQQNIVIRNVDKSYVLNNTT